MVLSYKRTHRPGSHINVELLKRSWPLVLALGCLLASPTVWAQQTQTSSHPKATTESVSTADVLPDALAHDPRLDAKVSLTRHSINIEDTCRELTKQTNVPLEAEDKDVAAGSVVIAVKDLPLRDVLRALAAVGNEHWKRVKTPDGRDGLLLASFADDPRYWDFNRPHSQGEADERTAVLSFADAASRLPADVRQALAVDNVGISYASLPPEMQQAAQDAIKPELASLADHHFPTKISLDNMNTVQVCLKIKPGPSTTEYSLNVVGQGMGNIQVGFSQPNDPHLRDEAVLPADFIPWQKTHLSALVASYDAARDKAAKDDPRLAQSVSLKTDDCSVGYPLVALSNTAHVPIIAAMLPVTHTISFGPVPLREALDQVAAKYRGAWTVTEDGVVIFHVLVRGLPGFWTPEEMAAKDAIVRAYTARRDRETFIKQAPPNVPLYIDGVLVKRDLPPNPRP